MRQGTGKWPHMGTFLLILTNIPVLLPTFRFYYQHFGFINNNHKSLPSTHIFVTM